MCVRSIAELPALMIVYFFASVGAVHVLEERVTLPVCFELTFGNSFFSLTCLLARLEPFLCFFCFSFFTSCPYPFKDVLIGSGGIFDGSFLLPCSLRGLVASLCSFFDNRCFPCGT